MPVATWTTRKMKIQLSLDEPSDPSSLSSLAEKAPAPASTLVFFLFWPLLDTGAGTEVFEAPSVDPVLVVADVAGTEVAGTDVAGTEVAGTEVAGTEVAGTDVAGTDVGTEVPSFPISFATQSTTAFISN